MRTEHKTFIWHTRHVRPFSFLLLYGHKIYTINIIIPAPHK